MHILFIVNKYFSTTIIERQMKSGVGVGRRGILEVIFERQDFMILERVQIKAIGVILSWRVGSSHPSMEQVGLDQLVPQTLVYL